MYEDQDPCRCLQVVFDQFSQYLNTSRNNVSTDFPYSPRISSTDALSARCPFHTEIFIKTHIKVYDLPDSHVPVQIGAVRKIGYQFL